MNCPNCSTSLESEARICFACGQEITEEMWYANKGEKDREFDEVIQNLILTDESEQAEDEIQVRQEQRKMENQKRQQNQRRYRITSFVTLGVMVLFLVSLWFPWFSIQGTVAYQGYFYTEKTAKYLADEVKSYSGTELVDKKELVGYFSAAGLLGYAKEYEASTEGHGLLAHLQVYYAKGLYLIYLLAFLCGLILIFDKTGKFGEVIRISSILSVIYVLLNTLAMKLTYINLIVLNAKRMLSESGISSRVVANGLQLLNGSKQELSYQANILFGCGFAVVFVAIWFVMATILMEMARSLKDKPVLERSNNVY